MKIHGKFKQVLVLFAAFVALTSCRQKAPVATPQHPVKIGHYLLDFGTFKGIDEAAALKHENEKYLASEAACTAVVADMGASGIIVGRNLDISLSEKAAYKFVLDINKYKAMGFGYAPFLGEDFETIMKDGVSEDLLLTLPFGGTDYLNEKGLYIQTNMRTYQEGFGNPGTNPDSDVTLHAGLLPVYLITRCATVDEAVNMAKELNLYTTEKGLNWNFCFMLADASGNYGLMEIAKNKVVYTPHQQGQANFYVDPDLASGYKFAVGESRLDTVLTGIENIKTQDQMLSQMEKVYYSLSYDYNNLEGCPYDMRSEFVQSIPVNKKGKVDQKKGSKDNCTTEWITSDKNKDVVYSEIKAMLERDYSSYMKEDGKFDFDAIRHDAGQIPDFWVSAFSFAVNPKTKTVKAHFWEDTSETLVFKF